MKRLIGLVLALVLVFSSLAYADWVNGYTRSNGTYVSGYNRSSPNNTVRDNYSYKGNTNPYTGAVGTDYYRNSPSSEYYGTQSNWGNSNSNSGYSDWGR